MSHQVVAVDIGTSAVRAAVVCLDGEIVASHRIRRASGLGGETFDPAALHRDVLSALAGVAAGTAPVAMAIAAHIGTVVVDAAGDPIGPAGGWADSRGMDRLTALDDALVRDLLEVSGRPALTGGALAHLLGLAPADRARAHAVLSPKDFELARLTGRLTTDTVDAAYTLASDVRGRTWHTAALDRLGLAPELFPRQEEPTAVVGELTAAAAAATGLPPGLPVAAGGPDGSVGIGLLLGAQEEIIADVAGTTDVVGRLLPRGSEAPIGSLLNPSVLPERFVAGGATGLTGGAVTHWRTLVGATDDDRLAAVPPGAAGLTILPTMTGARFPRWRQDARGAMLGQRPEHDAAHLIRAAQEAAAYTVREGLDLLDPTGRLAVAIAGGATRSAPAMRLRADILARRVLISPTPDVTLFGAASLAFVASGAAESLAEMRTRILGTAQEIEPDPARAARYAELYERWRTLREVVDEAQAAI
jgi:xylulokinase